MQSDFARVPSLCRCVLLLSFSFLHFLSVLLPLFRHALVPMTADSNDVCNSPQRCTSDVCNGTTWWKMCLLGLLCSWTEDAADSFDLHAGDGGCICDVRAGDGGCICDARAGDGGCICDARAGDVFLFVFLGSCRKLPSLITLNVSAIRCPPKFSSQRIWN